MCNPPHECIRCRNHTNMLLHHIMYNLYTMALHFNVHVVLMVIDFEEKVDVVYHQDPPELLPLMISRTLYPCLLICAATVVDFGVWSHGVHHVAHIQEFEPEVLETFVQIVALVLVSSSTLHGVMRRYT